MSNLARLIKLHMAANDIDNKTMAERLELSPITLSRFLAGKNISTSDVMHIMLWCIGDAQ